MLYKEVIKRHGIDAVIAKKQWKEVAEALQLPSSCTDSGFRLRLHYKKYLEAFERKHFKPPVEVELRERKSKKKSNGSGGHGSASGAGSPSGSGGGGSESAETYVGGEEDSVVSAEKGSEGKERQTQIVKRKKRMNGGGKREKKKEVMEHEGRGGIEAEQSRKEEKGVENGGEERNESSAMEIVHAGDGISGNVESIDEKSAGGKGSIQNGCLPSEEKQGTENTAGDVEKLEGNGENTIEREAARVLVEARSGEIGSLGVSKGGVEKRRRVRGEHKVDFTILDRATLKRYAQAHGGDKGDVLEGGKGVLAEWVGRHFRETPLRGGETAAVLRFIQAVRQS